MESLENFDISKFQNYCLIPRFQIVGSVAGATPAAENRTQTQEAAFVFQHEDGCV